jgi:hypothetical protein
MIRLWRKNNLFIKKNISIKCFSYYLFLINEFSLIIIKSNHDYPSRSKRSVYGRKRIIYGIFTAFRIYGRDDSIFSLSPTKIIFYFLVYLFTLSIDRSAWGRKNRIWCSRTPNSVLQLKMIWERDYITKARLVCGLLIQWRVSDNTRCKYGPFTVTIPYKMIDRIVSVKYVETAK